jgi:hypothetical protein
MPGQFAAVHPNTSVPLNWWSASSEGDVGEWSGSEQSNDSASRPAWRALWIVKLAQQRADCGILRTISSSDNLALIGDLNMAFSTPRATGLPLLFRNGNAETENSERGPAPLPLALLAAAIGAFQIKRRGGSATLGTVRPTLSRFRPVSGLNHRFDSNSGPRRRKKFFRDLPIAYYSQLFFRGSRRR